jgi:PAS domain S-box-containing protein
MSPERLSRVLRAQGLTGDAFATVADSKGTIVARSRNQDRFVGQPIPAWYGPATAGRQDGIVTGAAVQGGEYVFSFRHLDSAPGWTVVVARSKAAYDQVWRAPLRTMVLASTAVISVGLALAVWLSRRLLVPLDALVRHGRAVSAGEQSDPPDPVAEAPREFEALRHSLVDAEEALLARSAEAARLASALDVTEAMICRMDGTILHWSTGLAELSGWAAQEVEGRNAHTLLKTDFPMPYSEIEQTLRRDGRWAGQLVHQARDGRKVITASRWRLYREKAGAEPLIVRSSVDITARAEAERARDLLMRELDHRVKNSLATVQALAALSLLNAQGEPQRFQRDFTARLMALARAHDLLTKVAWESVDVEAAVRAGLAPWLGSGTGHAQIAILGGPRAKMLPQQVQALVLALHELATNAVKYGALSRLEGQVELRWALTLGGLVKVDWTEVGGPQVEQPPTHRGFGRRLLERGLARDLGSGATVEMRFERAGLGVSICFAAGGAER